MGCMPVLVIPHATETKGVHFRTSISAMWNMHVGRGSRVVGLKEAVHGHPRGLPNFARFF